ncbi:HAD-IIIA family hydrolase [Bdellovibrio sp. ArHS]|uniref:HAD-IIIA family hydrolase n=1 Tax=Bdellovibrio sp. ArHS TaxID=1569284 RepID=UPI000A685E1E|nr:HAD-IIIA family hydrolase [Bdellovibrio sp. ArHS]
MMQWETLIRETVQLGGQLVFLSDKAPADQDKYFEALRTHFNYGISFVKRSVADFQSAIFRTRAADLVLFFDTQVEFIDSLNSVLQGQRLVLAKGSFVKTPFVDFVWSGVSLKEWTQVLESLKQNWQQTAGLPQYSEALQSPCLFLDRDDVVVKNVPYNKAADKVQLLPGIGELINSAHSKGYWVALVTNQSGLGRGWISWKEYQAVHQQMLSLLAAQGAWIDECVWSGFIEEGAPVGNLYASLRKPRAGMLQMVHEKLHVRMENSILVGDSASDIIAGFSAGVGRLYLLSSDKLNKEKESLEAFKRQDPRLQYEWAQNFSDVIL